MKDNIENAWFLRNDVFFLGGGQGSISGLGAQAPFSFPWSVIGGVNQLTFYLFKGRDFIPSLAYNRPIE